jgi:uncharacterized protein (TIGR04551 family)
MRWYLATCLSMALCCAGRAAAQAQPAPPPAQPGAQPQPPAQPAAQPAPAPPASEGVPTEGTPAVEGTAPEAAPAPSSEQAPANENALPPPAAPPAEMVSPGEADTMLQQQIGAAPKTEGDWTAPAPVFTLHGYLRARGELMDTFWLGRRAYDDYRLDTTISGDNKVGQGPDPFTRFRPLEHRRNPMDHRAPAGLDCADEGTNRDGTCDVNTLRFANMRLRFSPELAVSEDIRVYTTFDVLDNVVLGERPASFYGEGPAGSVFSSGTVNPPNDSNGMGLGDSIRARRAWAMVRDRDLGELRFGRMAQSWGLGMYYNAGDGIDDDLSTDIDRVMYIAHLAGLYLSASYDFVGEGAFLAGTDDRPLDQSQLDDVDQFTFSVARRNTPEEIQAAKEKGELVLNGGVQFQIRNQDSIYHEPPPAGTGMTDMFPSRLQTINATTYTTDAWGQFRYRGLRLEGEFAWVTGGMDNPDLTSTKGNYSINQMGYALEAELRLVDDKLGIYFDHGLATGDSDVEGLSTDSFGGAGQSDFVTQHGSNRTVSTFRFHPSYHVDLILWRNIMRQVTGAYYFKPGVSYDFMHTAFGKVAGARLDAIWSRATSFLQTWGNDPDLGIELNASLYFHSEGGPQLTDGFQAMLQYGVLFPMRGLSYLHEDTNLDTAQTLRLLIAVVY